MGVFRFDPHNRHNLHPDDVLRVDRRLLLNGPIGLYNASSRMRRHIRALQSYGYRCPSFDCSAWDTEAAMHTSFAGELGFPGYYGRNLDALRDCLGDLDVSETAGTALVLWRFDRFARSFPGCAWHVLDVIADCAWFHIQYGRRLLGLVHSDDGELQFSPVGARPVLWISWEVDERRDEPV